MKWQFVYNGNVEVGSHIDDLSKFVRTTGYKFFHFNGWVYFLTTTNYHNTGISIDDLI